MSSYHGWTHRPKALGGTDPVETGGTPIWFASRTQSAGAITVTTPWTVNQLIPMSTSMLTNDADNTYFEEVTDGGGQHGIRVLQEGIYSWRVVGNIFRANAGTHAPPYFVLSMVYRTNFGGAFDVNNTFVTRQFHSSAQVYIPDGATEVPSQYGRVDLQEIQEHELVDLNSGSAAVPIDYTLAAVSFGGSEDFKFQFGGMEIIRWGDLEGTRVSQ